MQHRDPSTALQAAIALLKKFNDQIHSETIPNVSRLDLKEGTLVATQQNPFFRKVELVKSFIFTALSRDARLKMQKKKQQIQEELNNAIEVVKSHYRIIHELKNGNADQQRLAEHAEEVLKSFKSIVKQSKEATTNLTQKIARFFYDRTGSLLNDNLIEFDLPTHIPLQKKVIGGKRQLTPSSKKIEALADILSLKPEPITLTKELQEAFFVKVFSLARQHKIPVPFKELKHSVWNTPICAKRPEDSKIFISQTLSTIPGEIIRIEGDFKYIHHEESRFPAIISNRFELSYHYQPTGFPDPLYLGWCLADPLVPEVAHFPEQAPLLYKLLQQKKELAHNLLPEGHFFSHAKDLLKKMKDCFTKPQLEMHRELQYAICLASQDSKQAFHTIDAFFDALHDLPNSFQFFIDTQHLITDLFIKWPYEQLQKAWMTGEFHFQKEPDYLARFYKIREYLLDLLLTQKNQLNDFSLNTPQLNYIHLQLETLVPSCLRIILQHLSETMKFAPPQLSDFDHKLQAATFLQQKAFFALFKDAPLPKIEDLIALQIDLFKTLAIDRFQHSITDLVFELESYFNAHYYAARAKKSF